AYEEGGANPLQTDPTGFRTRTIQRIEKERVWVWVEDNRLIFKADVISQRSEEHTSELQSLAYLVCRLLLEKKNRSTPSSLPISGESVLAPRPVATRWTSPLASSARFSTAAFDRSDFSTSPSRLFTTCRLVP